MRWNGRSACAAQKIDAKPNQTVAADWKIYVQNFSREKRKRCPSEWTVRFKPLQAFAIEWCARQRFYNKNKSNWFATAARRERRKHISPVKNPYGSRVTLSCCAIRGTHATHCTKWGWKGEWVWCGASWRLVRFAFVAHTLWLQSKPWIQQFVVRRPVARVCVCWLWLYSCRVSHAGTRFGPLSQPNVYRCERRMPLPCCVSWYYQNIVLHAPLFRFDYVLPRWSSVAASVKRRTGCRVFRKGLFGFVATSRLIFLRVLSLCGFFLTEVFVAICAFSVLFRLLIK